MMTPMMTPIITPMMNFFETLHIFTITNSSGRNSANVLELNTKMVQRSNVIYDIKLKNKNKDNDKIKLEIKGEGVVRKGRDMEEVIDHKSLVMKVRLT